ncbi:MAG: carboxypeptidase regulatory-like domain-containing protein, partial [Gemmatimonadetes bacterium]|nr:carboxypeptidase regulatory-like domain-containing protein [Gemmatimonadota bacterium]
MSRCSAARFGGLSTFRHAIAAVFALALGPLSAFADSGITGRIISMETGSTLGFANVTAVRTDVAPEDTSALPRNTISNGDGSFRLACEPGTYRLTTNYVGFSPFEVTDVIVKDGSYEVVDLRLSPANLQVETVTVTAKALKNTSASLLARRKKAVAVSDGISAQQIRQGTDSNAAEAVNRVTGLSVVGGKYVYVRGLGERYSSAQLNGSVVGSPEANRRVLPLDLFPSSLLDNIVVQKTYTPDQPAEFGGGAVNVTTLDFPTNETWSFRVKGGANALVTGSDFRTYTGGSRDWLGFDDGTRGFPSLIDELAHDDLIKTPGSIINPGPFTADEVRDMGRSFSKVWSPSTESGRPAYSFSGTYGNLVDFLGRDLGFVASVSQGNSFSQYDYLDRRYENGDPLILADDLSAARSVSETSLGGLVNGALRVNSANTLRFTTNYTRTSHDEVRFREGSIDNDETVRQTRLRFIERGLLATTVGMDHTLRALGNSELKWRVDYSEATRDVPDQRSFQYENVGTDADPDWR